MIDIEMTFSTSARSTGILPVACAPARFDRRSNKQSRKRERLYDLSPTRLLFQAALEVPEYRDARAGSTVLQCFARHRTSSRCNAFTLPELCIGMIVVSMLLGALAAFTLATAQAWQQGISTNAAGNGQNITVAPLIGTLASARLDTETSSGLATGGYYSGTLTSSSGQQASLLLWKSDPNADTHIDAGEVELIEYDATDHAIYKYLPTATSPKADSYTTFSSTSFIASFKTTATKQALARNIDGMQVNVINPSSKTQLPLVEYRLYFNRGGSTQTRYGAVCLRSPETAYQQVLN